MINVIKAQVGQVSTNGEQTTIIPTLLTVDGRTGWLIKRFKATFMSPAAVVPTADAVVIVQLNTETGVQTFVDPDNIVQQVYLFNGIAASTSGFQIEPDREWYSDSGRLTVSPNIYVNLTSSGLGATALVNVEIEYETVKLTDLEVMRLLQGGV